MRRKVEGRSPYALLSEEQFAVLVSAAGRTDDPYGYPSPRPYVELRIGSGRRARIAHLDSKAARRLAYRLIEASVAVEVNKAKVDAFDKGIEQGQDDIRRERTGATTQPA